MNDQGLTVSESKVLQNYVNFHFEGDSYYANNRSKMSALSNWQRLSIHDTIITHYGHGLNFFSKANEFDLISTAFKVLCNRTFSKQLENDYRSRQLIGFPNRQ